MILSSVMIASGAVCFVGALCSRSGVGPESRIGVWRQLRVRLSGFVGIAAVTLMLLAMTDLVVFHTMEPVFWAATLTLSGLALALRLRVGEASNSVADSLLRSVNVTTALSYPAAAWLVVTHHPGAAPGVTDTHLGHSNALPLALLVTGIIAGIAVVLALQAYFAARRRRAWPMAEAAAMSTMLFAMLAHSA